MPHSLSRRHLLQAGLAFVMAPQARACEFYSSNLRILHPWARAVAADAPFAIVCMKFDEVRQDDRLIGVETPVARSAEMAGPQAAPGVDFEIPAGRESVLGETGTQLRLVGLNQAIELGCAYELVLTFERGGRVNAQLSVDYTGFRFR